MFNGVIKINMAKALSQKFGGKWKYDNKTAWWCDDKKRYVSKVYMGGEYEFEPGYTSYVLYGDGIPKWLSITPNGVETY